MGKIRSIAGSVLHAPERIDQLAAQIVDTNQRIRITEDNLRGQLNRLDMDWFMNQLYENRDMLQELNRVQSIVPTVWGDPERLEIDETAKVFTCFFNTNSGRIKVGEATFAGSGVSILAGTHDPKLKGVLRRDAELKEGCDIEIGKGVWLASGCTVLGPCKIGDHAVIAAGAVLTPGTVVPTGTIWGGVPARQIGEVPAGEMTPDHPAVQEVFERSDGMLLTDGWGERVPGLLKMPGNWMYKQEARLMSNRREWLLHWRREEAGECRLRITGASGEENAILRGSEGKCHVTLPIAGERLEEIRLTRDSKLPVFIAFTPEVGKEGADSKGPLSAEGKAETDREEILDIEAIMEEIRAEARKNTPYDLPEFEQTVSGPEACSGQLMQDVMRLTDNYVIPPVYVDQSLNPLKRLYRKWTRRAMGCVTVPLTARVTETNQHFRTALEETTKVIEQQQRQIEELTKRIRDLEG